MAEGLDLDPLFRDIAELCQGKLAGDRDAADPKSAAPGGSAPVMDVRLRGDMDLYLGPDPLDLGHEAPVLDDEGIGAEAPGTPDHIEHLRHLLGADHDIDRHVDAHASEMGRAAGSREGLLIEVVGIPPGIEVVPEAAIDGICPGGQGSRKRLRAACGCQKLEGMPRFLILHGSLS